MTEIHGITWHNDAIEWAHDIKCHIKASSYRSGFHLRSLKSENHGTHIFWPCDLDLWPMTLTIELALPMFKSLGQTVRPWECWMTHGQTDRHTHTHTDETDSFTSTADTGGKNIESFPGTIWLVVLKESATGIYCINTTQLVLSSECYLHFTQPGMLQSTKISCSRMENQSLLQ